MWYWTSLWAKFCLVSGCWGTETTMCYWKKKITKLPDDVTYSYIVYLMNGWPFLFKGCSWARIKKKKQLTGTNYKWTLTWYVAWRMLRCEVLNHSSAQKTEHYLFRWEGPIKGQIVWMCGPGLFSHSSRHFLEFLIETSRSQVTWSPKLLRKFMFLGCCSKAAETLMSKHDTWGSCSGLMSVYSALTRTAQWISVRVFLQLNLAFWAYQWVSALSEAFII